MSVARGFGQNGKSLYSNITKPCEVNLQFTVNAADTGGFGVTSVKSNGYVQSVFMHTSQTPAAGSPNPLAGYIAIQLKNNFNVFLKAEAEIISPNSGSDIKIDNSALTQHQLYTISILGNASLATWQGVGLPAGVTPAVGVSFIATGTGGSGNTLTSRVQAPSATGSGVIKYETVGNPNLTANSNIATNNGQWLFGQFLAATDSTTTTLVKTNPADGTIVCMKIYVDGSTVTIDGL